MDLSTELKRIREDAGLSQQKMADLIGIPQKSWYNYESGRSSPKMDVLLALAAKGYTIKGITSSFMEEWPEDQKKELHRRMSILKTEVFPPEMPMDDFVKILKAVDDNPKPNTGGSGLVLELEKIIKKSQAILDLESRISAIEAQLKKAAPKELAEPEIEYELDDANEGYTGEPEPGYCAIPFYDSVAAGPPINQSEDESMRARVPRRFIKTIQSDYYAVRVRGNSMIDAYIPDGSVVLIRKTDIPQHGKIQLVRIDGEVTLKRMHEGEGHNWTLHYEDGSGRTIPLGEDNLVQGDFEAVLPPNTRTFMREELA